MIVGSSVEELSSIKGFFIRMEVRLLKIYIISEDSYDLYHAIATS